MQASPFHEGNQLQGVHMLTKVGTALEDYHGRTQVDLLVSFNAVPHVRHGVIFLKVMFDALKIGGILILNDNIYWDNVHEDLHPVKVRWTLWQEFLSAFDVLHSTIEDRACLFASAEGNPAAGLYGESGSLYIIAQKIKSTFPLEHLLV